MHWREPWCPVNDDPVQAASLESELRREVSEGHVLFGLPARALARRQDCDDVLFAVEDRSGRVAVVHLTWPQSHPEQPPWPGTTFFTSFEAWRTEGMNVDAAEFGA